MSFERLRLLLGHAFSTWRARRSELYRRQRVIDALKADFAAELEGMAGCAQGAISARALEQQRQVERLELARDGIGEWPESDEAPAGWAPKTAGERLGSVLEPLGFGLALGALFNLLQSPLMAALLLGAAVVSFLAGVILQAGPLPLPIYARGRLSPLAELSERRR